MARGRFLTVAAVLAGLAALGCGSGSDGDAGGSAEGRLTVGIVNGEPVQCVFDARVTLTADGTVHEVDLIGEAAAGKIEPGMVVEGAAEVFPDGAAIPVPVHLDENGALRGSYASCEPQGTVPAPVE